jgi:hypothetical protein
MVVTWLVLVPIGVMSLRFLKPPPTGDGIVRGTGRFERGWLWWTIHWGVLYSAIALSLAGATVALVVSKGFSGSLHSIFGITTVVLGALQIIAAWRRGTHGGKHGIHSDPNVPSTWRGDHYDMTSKRRWFEAYHKTAGYFTIALALATIVSGLMQHWAPLVASVVIVAFWVLFGLAIMLERLGLRQDTYQSVFGNDPNHPYNKVRTELSSPAEIAREIPRGERSSSRSSATAIIDR